MRVGIKNWCYKLVGILALLLIIVSVFLYIDRQKLAKELAKNEKTFKKAVDIIRYKDKEGQNHVTFNPERHKITYEMAKRLPIMGTLDTVAKALDIKNKQIQEWQKIALTSQAQALQARAERDSLKKLHYRYRNDWIDLTYTPDSVAEQPGKFSYKYDVELNSTQYRKWGKTFIDVYPTDTNAVINHIDRFTIVPKEPFFKARIRQKNILRIDDQKNRQFLSGSELEVDFGKATLGGGYFYNFGTGQFEKIATLGFKLAEY